MPAITTNTSLAPYTGSFTRAHAQHLLRRTTLATQEARIEEAMNLGLLGSITQLFSTPPSPGLPINRSNPNDSNVSIGESFVNADGPPNSAAIISRATSLKVWLIEQYCQSDFNINSRMTLFWYNHFAVFYNLDARASYNTQMLYWNFATGDFRELVKRMTVDFNMLKFLNGDQNVAALPNENFARELLELFTVGKGPQVGSGDYTNYTEQDVQAIAKALTGWQVRNNNSTAPGARPESYFTASRHDPSPRTLSARFNNKVLTVVGEDAYKEVVDTIFDSPSAAHYLCRKLYRYFVYYEIDSVIEQNIIEPLAQTLKDNNFVLAPVLQTLLSSEHFFQQGLFRALIKSPLDLLADVTYGTSFPLPTDPIDYELILDTFHSNIIRTGMDLTNPPSVAGHEAWHIAPLYQRMWINSPSLKQRILMTSQIFGHGFLRNGTRYTADMVSFIEDIPNAEDPNVLIASLCERFLGVVLNQANLDFFKNFLLGGLPDFEWTVEYNNMLANPSDTQLRQAVEGKLDVTCRAFFAMPEIHLY